MPRTPVNVRALRGSLGVSEDGIRARTDWMKARFSGVSFPRVSHGPLISDASGRSRVYPFCPSSLVTSALTNPNNVFCARGKPAVKPYWCRSRLGLGDLGVACPENHDRAFQSLS